MEQPPPLTPESPPAPPRPARLTLPARLLNVFAVPGDVFEEVRTARPCAANWLVPALIACGVGVISVLVVFSQPAIQQRVREQQQQALEQKLDKQVRAGTLSREQADRTMAAMEAFLGPTMLKLSGSVSAVAYGFARVFFWAAVLWALGRWWLAAPFGYGKAAEVAGLAGMIGVLGMVVKALLQINFGNPAASPSLALAVGEFDPRNLSHLLLAMVDLFDLWQVGALASGLARLTGAPWLRAAVPLLGVWLVLSGLLIAASALALPLAG